MAKPLKRHPGLDPGSPFQFHTTKLEKVVYKLYICGAKMMQIKIIIP